MLRIGLTGGIGCGKTTAAGFFKDLDIPVIDADEIAHALVNPDQPTLVQIIKCFGRNILNADGSLDRSRLRNLVFSDPVEKSKLEEILHPRVYDEINHQLADLHTVYAVLCIPLLLETQMQHTVDRVLIIDSPLEMRIERIKSRDGLTEERILSIINSQVSREKRLTAADDIIVNDSGITKLAEQIKKLHNLYLSLGVP